MTKSKTKKATIKANKSESGSGSDLEIRLQKFIADCGVTSRRKAEVMIREGRVTINGEVANEMGTKVNPNSDIVMVDGHLADLNAVEPIYLMLHKPRGVVTTLNDPEGRETVMDMVKEISERIYPVGRLDYLSEGLLLMTNDGEFANMIMHPKYNVTKVYEVKVFGSVTETILNKLKAGAYLEEGLVKPTSVRIIKQLPTKTWIEFRLNEGRNREIRRLCEAVGLTVDKLKRLAIGNLSIEGVAPGNFRVMSKMQMLGHIGLNEDGSPKKVLNQEGFVSAKKTIDLKKKRPQAGTMADDETFQKFRRETYFDALKQIHENKSAVANKIQSLSDQVYVEEQKNYVERRKKVDAVKASIKNHNREKTTFRTPKQ
ncbi:MAG: rRNA pseudouridine synthase [Bacteriovorax sp.]|nr:rRNA pseudouridine synthase [Bacteriovorax sp.]